MSTIIDAHPMCPEPTAPGLWLHPAFPWNEVPDETSAEPYLLAWGFECTAFHLDSETSPAATAIEDRISNASGDVDWCDWRPEPPPGLGWFLVAMHDTEDGPVAMFARSLASAIRERHGRLMLIEWKARALLEEAAAAGVVLTVEQRATMPPAMGKYRSEISVREVRS